MPMPQYPVAGTQMMARDRNGTLTGVWHSTRVVFGEDVGQGSVAALFPFLLEKNQIPNLTVSVQKYP